MKRLIILFLISSLYSCTDTYISSEYKVRAYDGSIIYIDLYYKYKVGDTIDLGETYPSVIIEKLK